MRLPRAGSATLVFARSPPSGKQGILLTFLAAVLLATMVIALMIYICFAYSDRVPRLLGAVGTDILVRLTPFILFCLGVQIIWTGASELLGTVTLQRATMAMPLVTTIVAASVRGCASVRRAAALQTGYCLLRTGHVIARDQTHRAPPHTPSALAKSP